MIRPLRPEEAGEAAALWLAANLQAHNFIDANYWQEHFDAVRARLAEAEVYVYEADGQLLGFIGLDGSYIAGLFVAEAARGRGVGRELLDCAKARRAYLVLNVYEANPRAAAFYRREGFRVLRRGADPDTGQREWTMRWEAVSG